MFIGNKIKDYFFSISTPEIDRYVKEELWICIVEHINDREKYFTPQLNGEREKYHMTIVRHYTMSKRYVIQDYLNGKYTQSSKEWCDRLFKRSNRNKILLNILD